ncbi:hypothetical protein Tco_0058759 [Tanacetum coccineum]
MNCYQPPLAALAVQDLQRVPIIPVVRQPVPVMLSPIPVVWSLVPISCGLPSASLKSQPVSYDQQHAAI